MRLCFYQINSSRKSLNWSQAHFLIMDLFLFVRRDIFLKKVPVLGSVRLDSPAIYNYPTF